MKPLPTRFTETKIVDILSQSPNATAIYSGEEIYIEFANDAMIALWGKDRSAKASLLYYFYAKWISRIKVTVSA